MVRASVCVLAALGLSASTAFAQAPARDNSAKTGTGIIRGRVVMDGANTAMPKVQVRASSPELRDGKIATTDSNGRYELAELPAGKYTVTATKPNFVRLAFGQTRPQGLGQPIEVANGQVVSNINFTLQRSGAITGRILDEFGEPVTNVTVLPMRSQFMNGERRMMPTGRGGSTNDLGEFRVYGLDPGQYYVSARFQNFQTGDSDDRTGYSPTYYPGTGSVAEAQRVGVEAGQTVAGINMTLLPVRTTRVSGTAVDSQGRPLVGAMIMAIEQSGAGGMVTRSPAPVKADGTFALGSVTPGTYTLRAQAPGTQEMAIVSVTVGGDDLNNVQLIAAPQSTVRGRILIDRGATPPKASMFRVSAMASEPMMGGGQAHINDDFTFEITLPPGHVNISAGPAAPLGADGAAWRLHAVRLNDLDISDRGLDVTPNANIAGLVVEMTTTATGATGKVLDENGLPLHDVWVVMFAQDSDRWSPPTRYVGVARPDVDNVYKANVPAGDYLLVAIDQIEPGEWNDPDVLRQWRERAIKVSVGDGEQKTVDLKLAR